MRRLLAISLIAPLSACGAHLHRPLDDQLARGATAAVEQLDWDQAFALDRQHRDEMAANEAELSRAYADTRRQAELLDILTEPVGARSWTKLEDRLVELAACMLDEPVTNGGRACRGGITDTQREVARAVLFDACPDEGCTWVLAVAGLRSASATLGDALAAYDRARGFAGIGDDVASPAQCPVPTRVPSVLAGERELLERACTAYEQALGSVAMVLPESSELRHAITDYRELVEARDAYRHELRMLVAELSPVRFGAVADPKQLDDVIARYVALQAKYTVALGNSKVGDFGDLALEGVLLVTQEHRAAVVRILATLGARIATFTEGEPGSDTAGASEPTSSSASSSFRDAGGSEPPAGSDPTGSDPPSPRPVPGDPVPPRPIPGDPVPPRPLPDPTPPEPPTSDRDPGTDTPAPVGKDRVAVDRELVRSLGGTLVPIFGDTWRSLHEQRSKAERGTLLVSAELERIQINAMTRRLAFTEERIWLELAVIEVQLSALVRLRLRLDADWIPAERPPAAELDELDRLRVALDLAQAEAARVQTELDAAVAKATGKPGKTGHAGGEALVSTAKLALREAQAGVDAAADVYYQHLQRHGAALCRRNGTVTQTYEREPACVDPIERLVGLHAQLVGASLPRLESLDRSASRRYDEAILLRDEAALEIRVTYIAASVAALQQYATSGIEPRDVAAIVGAVVGIGLGAAVTAGVYIP